jgi:GT2 family glycosyltransferase
MVEPSVSAVVVTYQRPDYVARCLDHLLAQTRPIGEIVVVDSSDDDETARLVADHYPGVDYVTNTLGRGHTAAARDIGYRRTTGEILAFVDDDAFAEPDWLEHLVPFYADPTVGGVGGRQIRRQPGELTDEVDTIGRLLPDGTLTGGFAADPGHPVDVDHLLGANMSFRRSAIDAVGGIRDGYGGTCLREETDVSLQVTGAGYRLVYTPDAVVEHVAGPYAKGERFDLRYAYWGQKNHTILLIRNFGLTAPVVRAYTASSLAGAGRDASTRFARARSRAREGDRGGAVRAGGAAVLRPVMALAGTVTGVGSGVALTVVDRRSGRGHRNRIR